jgi:type II secretory pathway component PulM
MGIFGGTQTFGAPMNGYWNNLRPMEKRLVVGVGTMVVILLNLWFVVPHFSDLTKVHQRREKARTTLEMFQKEIDQKDKYIKGIAQLQGEGQNVPPEDQVIHFLGTIQSQAAQSGVQILNTVKPRTETNQFFIEQIQDITVQSKEPQLVDFLYRLGEGNSLIRVRSLTLHADPSHTLLQSGIKLVASYQKKPTVKSAPVSAPAKSAPIEKKTTLRVNPTTPATNQGPAKPGLPLGKPGATNRIANPNIKKP